MNKLNKKILIIFFLLGVFFLAIIVWYLPIIFKGYSFQVIPQEILLARNYSQTGIFATQNDRNVVLSSNLLKENGHILSRSQNFRSLLYAKIFDVFGVPNYNKLPLFSIILYAIGLVLFTILILYLFNLKIAGVFALTYIFSPLSWNLVYRFGFYEFCLIFWAIFFIFYFWGIRTRGRVSSILFFLSGVFLTLASLAREIVFVFALAFFVFLLIKKLKKQLVWVFVPFIIILIIFWLPSFLKGESSYLPLLGEKATEEANFSTYMHVFPDPYTYYFERNEFLNNLEAQNLGISENLEIRKGLTNFGYRGIGIIDRLKVGIYILVQHLLRFFSLQEFGGPFIFLLLISGFLYLKKNDKFLYQFSIYWLIISFFIFAFVFMVSRNHLMDFLWLLILFIVLGLSYLFQIIWQYFKITGKKLIFLEILVIGLLIYHFALISHIILSEQYDKDFMPRSLAYIEKIKGLNINNSDVIAIPGDFADQADTLNYLVDKSFVIFKPATVEKLLKEEKINQGFKAFNVKYILGYSDELSKLIIKEIGLVNIAPNSLKIDIDKLSEDKSFIMNLFR